jgi:hypothetical protein
MSGTKQFTRVRFIEGSNNLPGYWIRRCNDCNREMVVSKHADDRPYEKRLADSQQASLARKGVLFE